MVHLTSIPTDEHILNIQEETGSSFFPISDEVSSIKNELENDLKKQEDKVKNTANNAASTALHKLKHLAVGSSSEDGSPDDRFTTTVYASKFAAQDLPKHRMPDREMPREVAYRMIKDETSLDGNPMLNLASFVTTYMEDEAEKLMTESFAKNFIDYEEYPMTAELQNRCVSMIGRLFNAPVKGDDQAIGTSTVGSSEAVMLAVLAMKKRWQNKRKAEGKDWHNPNMIMSSAVQVVWEKAMKYFEVEEKYVYCTRTRYVVDPQETVDLIDENTIGICLILGTTYTGQYEDIKAVSNILTERGMDTPIHVDAASGGFVAPFVCPELEWDFRVPHVASINVSGHKYGLVYPGVGWVVFRSPEYLPQELVFTVNYLGADQSSYTLNFSKGASQIVGQYYQLIRLGKRGYTAIMTNLTRTADHLADVLSAMDFIIMSERSGKGLPVVAFRFRGPEDGGQERHFDEFALAHQLRSRGWIVPAYTMAPHTNELKMLRVVVREDFSRSRCEQLILDIKLCMGLLEEMDEKQMQMLKDFVAKRRDRARGHRWGGAMHNKGGEQKQVAAGGVAGAASSGGDPKGKGPQPHGGKYANQDHNLQGKTGKTHPVC